MIPDSSNCSLGGLALPVGGLWADQPTWSPVRQSTRRSLGGTLHVFPRQVVKGRSIDLVFQAPDSWLLWSHRVALEALAAQVGAMFTLTWNGDTFQVMFRHDDPPALDITVLNAPGTFLPSGHPDDPVFVRYAGTLKLIEV